MKNFINIISTLFGIIAALIGIINLFWGNDPFFGLFILLLSVAYFPGLSAPIQRRINITIPSWSLLLLSLFYYLGQRRCRRAIRENRTHATMAG